MKISTEFKIGLTSLLTIIVIIWGVNYLKGRNILNRTYSLISYYDEVNGLEASAPVLLKGFKIGYVEEVIFKTTEHPPFMLKLNIERKYPVPLGSRAEIFSADLLGSMAVRILPSASNEMAENGEEITGSLAESMLGTIAGEISPLAEKLSSTISTLDSVGTSLQGILSSRETEQMLKHLESASNSLDKSLSSSGDLGKAMENLSGFSTSLNNQIPSIENSIKNIEMISSQVSSSGLDSLLMSLKSTAASLASVTEALENGKGSAGKLINEDSLYLNLDQLIIDLDALVKDLQSDPKKYVGFSIFGK